jgi:hypothetical protein
MVALPESFQFLSCFPDGVFVKESAVEEFYEFVEVVPVGSLVHHVEVPVGPLSGRPFLHVREGDDFLVIVVHDLRSADVNPYLAEPVPIF